MGVRGLKTIYVALKDASGQTLMGEEGLSESGVYEIDTNKKNGNLGSRTANISNLAGSTTKVSGNNQVVDVEVGDAAPTVTIDSNAINPTVMQKLLGREQSASGAWIPKDGVTESALIIETQERVTGQRVWFAFGRGIMTQSSQNVQTDTDTAKTPEDDNLTFTAEGYQPWNNKTFATYYEGDTKTNIANVFKDVFPGSSFTPAGATTQGGAGTSKPGGSAGGSASQPESH